MPDGSVRVQFNLTPKQREFLNLPHRYRLFLGGVGSGKTTAGCLEVIRVCLFYPGSQVLVMRKTARELEKTTLQVLEELLLQLNEEVGGKKVKFYLDKSTDGQYFLVKSLYRDGEIGHSFIYWTGADKVDKIQGMNLSGFFVDEAREIEQEFFDVLRSRLRNPRGPRRGWLASLPPPSGHWLDRLFLQGEGGEEYGYIHATTFDNPNLPQDFIEDIMRYDERIYRELVLGEQIPSAVGGPIITNFSKKHHVLAGDRLKEKLDELGRLYGERLHVYRGIDFGYHHPACVWGTFDSKGRFIVLREYIGEKMTLNEFLGKITAIDAQEGWRVLADFHDPHSTYTTDLFTVDRVEIMKEKGLHPVPASCRFEDGIHMLQKLFGTLIFGEPMLQLSERCRLLILGFEGEYCWDRTGTKVRDSIVVHLVDALRYMVMGLWGRLSSNMSVTVPKKEKRWSGFSYNEDFAR